MWIEFDGRLHNFENVCRLVRNGKDVEIYDVIDSICWSESFKTEEDAQQRYEEIRSILQKN
jgi:hypothetical protein